MSVSEIQSYLLMISGSWTDAPEDRKPHANKSVTVGFARFTKMIVYLMHCQDLLLSASHCIERSCLEAPFATEQHPSFGFDDTAQAQQLLNTSVSAPSQAQLECSKSGKSSGTQLESDLSDTDARSEAETGVPREEEDNSTPRSRSILRKMQMKFQRYGLYYPPRHVPTNIS